jgi:hypothetical protein
MSVNQKVTVPLRRSDVSHPAGSVFPHQARVKSRVSGLERGARGEASHDPILARVRVRLFSAPR